MEERRKKERKKERKKRQIIGKSRDNTLYFLIIYGSI
jgi:hypothetical protein